MHFGARKTPAGLSVLRDADRARLAKRAAGVAFCPKTPGRSCTPRGPPASPRAPSAATRTARCSRSSPRSNMGFTRNDTALLVMPLFHANSLFFATAFAYCGASTWSYDRKQFRSGALLGRCPTEQVTFTSLVPTHYIMMLALAGRRAGEVRRRQRHQAPDLLRPGPQGDEAGHHGAVQKLAALRNVRLHRGGMGDAAASRRATHASWARSAASSPAAGAIKLLDDQGEEVADGRGGRALLAHALCVRRLLEAAREDRRGVPRRHTARSATWRGGTRTVTTTSWIARAT